MPLLPKIDNFSTGLVLSGGGVKGMSHIGVLKALKERNIEPHLIAGVSAGALVGALYAKGLTINEMLYFFKQSPLFKYDYFTITKPGILDTEKYVELLKHYFIEDNFNTLHKKLYIIATKLEDGEETVFSTGKLFLPLLASAAAPPFFSPINIGKHYYTDGALVDNFPVNYLIKDCSFIIGSYVNSIKNKTEIKNAWQLTQRANQIMLHANSKNKLHIPNILFQPEGLNEIGLLDKRGIDKAFKLGYIHASKVLNKLDKS